MRTDNNISSCFVEFRGELLWENEANALKQIEEKNNIELRPKDSSPSDTEFTVRGYHVIELIISSYRGPIIESLPDAIGELKFLKRLNISRNKLTNLPESIGNLCQLEKLNLNNNQLKTLPDSFTNLKNLKKLDLSNNRLSTLPEEFRKLRRLSELNLGYNHIEHLPQGFWNLRNLERLRLNNNCLCEISELISKLSKLGSLDVSENNGIKLPWTLENSYSQQKYFRMNFPTTARIIPPQLLFSKNRELRTEIVRCFEDSIPILENLDDYIEDWVSGNERLYPYLLKLGQRLRYALSRYRFDNTVPKNQNQIEALSKDIDLIDKKSSIRIQFINFSEYMGSRSYPMGLLYVSAYLKEHSFTNVEYFDYICVLREREKKPSFGSHRDEHKEIVRRLFSYLDERNPHLIFVGPITSMHLVELNDLVPKLRERYSRTVLLAGGPHFGKKNEMDKELLHKYCKGLDGLIVGESEETVVEITERFYSDFEEDKAIPPREEFAKKLQKIPGVLTKNSKFNGRKPPDLENMPFPDMDLLEEYWKSSKIQKNYPSPKDYYSLCERRNPVVLSTLEYFEGDADWGSYFYDKHYFDEHIYPDSYFPFGIIVGSRCCPFKCTFCSSLGKRRFHSGQYIFKQMVELYEKYGINLFVFFDPLFTTSSPREKQRIEELCNMLLEGNYGFKYIIDIRCDVILKLPDELLVKIIQSGCSQFNLGLEKGANKALKKFKKGEPIENHLAAIEKLRNAARKARKEIFINGTFILGGAEETKVDIKDTLMHGFSLDLDGLIFYPLEIHPGTEIYNEALQEGILESGLIPYLKVKEYPIYSTNILPREYLFHIKELSDQTIERLRDLRNTIRQVELQQLQSKAHNTSDIKGYKMGTLFEYVRRFIGEALSYIKTHPNKHIVKNREHLSPPVFVSGDNNGYYVEVKNLEIISPLKKFADEVNNQIKRIEDPLFKRGPNYDDSVGDYHCGEMTLKWREFITRFDLLFSEVMK